MFPVAPCGKSRDKTSIELLKKLTSVNFSEQAERYSEVFMKVILSSETLEKELFLLLHENRKLLTLQETKA